MIICHDAREFLEAAQIVRPQKPLTYMTTYFLVCQSIELSLKAYLRGSGYSEEQLRRLGHNLDKCVSSAKTAGVDTYVSLSEADVAAIAKINPYYQYKDFQYSKSGFKSYPHPDYLIALAQRLWDGLHAYCAEHRKYHFGKPTAIA